MKGAAEKPPFLFCAADVIVRPYATAARLIDTERGGMN
jgi:hypothetical protein